MNTYRVSRQAEIDLQTIWNYIAERESLPRADRVILDLHDGFERVNRIPSLGHLRRDAQDPRLLFFVVHKFLIVYVTHPTQVEIVTIIHGARDVPSVLRQRRTP